MHWLAAATRAASSKALDSCLRGNCVLPIDYATLAPSVVQNLVARSNVQEAAWKAAEAALAEEGLQQVQSLPSMESLQ